MYRYDRYIMSLLLLSCALRVYVVIAGWRCRRCASSPWKSVARVTAAVNANFLFRKNIQSIHAVQKKKLINWAYTLQNNACCTSGETQVVDGTPEVYVYSIFLYYKTSHFLFLGGELDCREGDWLYVDNIIVCNRGIWVWFWRMVLKSPLHHIMVYYVFIFET